MIVVILRQTGVCMRWSMYRTNAQAVCSLAFSVDMWEIHSTDQTVTFMLSWALGGLLCAVYDILRGWRLSLHSGIIAVFFQDTFFGIFASVTTFLFLLARSCGEIRLYVLVGEVIGFVLFRMSFSGVLLAFFRILFSGLRWIKKQFSHLYDLQLKLFTCFFERFRTFYEKKIKNMRNKAKKLLKK